MSIENATGRSDIAAEQELLTLFENNWVEQQAGETSTNPVYRELRQKVSRLAGRNVIVYALHANSYPIMTVDQPNNPAYEADHYSTRSGYIMRELADNGKLGIALSKCQAKEITRIGRGKSYAVEVCDPETGEPNVGFIIH